MIKLHELEKGNAANVMTERVEIYVPSTKNKREVILLTEQEHQDETFKTITLFSSLFGGATYETVVGAWTMQNGELVKERINIVYSFSKTDILKQHFMQVLEEAKRIKIKLGQEAVMVVVNCQAILV